MRIGSYGPILTESPKQVSATKAAGASDQTAPLSAQGQAAEDTTTLSASTKAVQSLTQAALTTANLRAAKVDALKQAVNSAQYQLDSAKIAEALSNGQI